MIIGSHVSYSKEGLLGSVSEALSYDANTFMFYTGAPQNTIRSSIDEVKTKMAHDLMKKNNIDINNVICHAPYIINLANRMVEDKWQFSVSFLKKEIHRCEMLGVKYLVLHPGSAVSHTLNEAITNIADGLNLVLEESDSCMVLLETMAGKGTECGKTTEEIKMILDKVIYKNKIGVCLDTCHLNDAGYNIKDFDNYLDDFNNKIGIKKIKCVHINDSLNIINSHKDRHANIGYGTIGFDNLINVIYNDRLKDVPKILETPYIKDYPPYKVEIKSIREKKFNINLENDVIRTYDI